METRKIKDAKDLMTNELIYFKGHAKATYMSNGKTVEDAINQIGTGGDGGGITTEIDPIFSASPSAKITDVDIEEWNSKQDVISDLESIRNNASKGAQALDAIPTKVSQLENDEGYLSHQDISGLATKDELQGKVDKVDGKQLSTEDFTTLLKQKLDSLSNYDDTEISQAVSKLRTDLDTLVSGDTTTAIKTFNEVIAFLDGVQDTQDLTSIIASIEQQIAGKMDKVTLATVATSGSYNDLSNKPTIPSAVTESTVSGWGFTKNTGTYSKPSTGIPKTDLASAVQTSLGKADTALQSYTEQYKGTVTGVKINGTTKNPSSGVVDLGTVITSHQDISGKQDKLVSGTNIKTINGTSILGSGNIAIEGGGSGSESPIFFTHFSIDEFISGYVPFTDEQIAAIREAASQNKIIAIPYDLREHYAGFVVALYSYSCSVIDGEEYWSLYISFMYDSAFYENSMDHWRNGFNPGMFSMTSFEPYWEEIEVDEDGYAGIHSEIDNSTFLVLGECRYLSVYCYVTIIGATVRFFTGEDCTLEMYDVYWANGVVPTIEPYTHYELSITINQEYGHNAVLTPFKPVE